MNVNDLFPSKYLSGEDLVKSGEVFLTIKAVERDALPDKAGDKVVKGVVRFEEEKRGLVLNRTNANRIAKMHSTETDNWVGKKITLYPESVEAFGKIVDAVRVRLEAPKLRSAESA